MASGGGEVTTVVQILISKDSIKTRQATVSTLQGGSNTYTPWVSYSLKSEVIDWDTLTFVPKADDETGAITFDFLG